MARAMALRHWHRGQTMVETVLAVTCITFAFFILFWLSHLLTAKILVQHAAMRVARARSVGLNDFMCLKAARLSVLPVAGSRIRPADADFTYEMERARFANYMATPTPPIARAVLDYEGWKCLKVDEGNGQKSKVRLRTCWLDAEDAQYFGFDVTGKAGVEPNAALYLNNAGL